MMGSHVPQSLSGQVNLPASPPCPGLRLDKTSAPFGAEVLSYALRLFSDVVGCPFDRREVAKSVTEHQVACSYQYQCSTGAAVLKEKAVIAPHSAGHGLSTTSRATDPNLWLRQAGLANPSLSGTDSSRRTIMVNGRRVAYRDDGAGEVLLLIHGMGASSYSWRTILPKLSQNYRVIAPDLPGHGHSDEPSGPYSAPEFALWLRDLLDALGIPAVTVVGHSFGGGVAMHFALQYRNYCRRLVLLSSGGFGREVSPFLRMFSVPGAGIVLPLLASRPKTSSAACGEPSTVRESLSHKHLRRAFLCTLRSAVGHRGQKVCALESVGALVDLPTQIISGEADKVIPVAHAHAAHAALPGSRLHVIAGAGHSPQTQCPDTVAELVDSFLASTSRFPHPTATRAGLVSLAQVA